WVQVDDQQVDATDAVLFDGLEMLGHVATCQQAPVYLGVQGLDAAVEDFGGAGVVGHFLNLQAAFGQQLGSAARGQQLYATCCQRPREVEDASLVGNRYQGTLYGHVDWRFRLNGAVARRSKGKGS